MKKPEHKWMEEQQYKEIAEEIFDFLRAAQFISKQLAEDLIAANNKSEISFAEIASLLLKKYTGHSDMDSLCKLVQQT